MRTFVLFMLSLVTLPCFSMTNVDLYHSQVPLDPESSHPEQDAQVAALKNVIVRATGDENAADNAVIQKALENTSDYVANVGYVHHGHDKSLKVGFNEKNIRALITQSQLPFWPSDRMTVLVWFVTDNGYQRSVIWENTANEEVSALTSLADKRGIPLIIPVGDIDDISNVEVSDLWGDFVKPIAQDSQRYSPDAVLVVRADQNHDLNWTLYDESPDKMMTMSALPVYGKASGKEALGSLVNNIANYYAHKHSIVIAGESALSVYLNVSHLDNALEFFSLENRLKSLSSVASVEVQDARSHDVMYRVNLLASKQAFETELAKIKALSKTTANSTDVGTEEGQENLSEHAVADQAESPAEANTDERDSAGADTDTNQVTTDQVPERQEVAHHDNAVAEADVTPMPASATTEQQVAPVVNEVSDHQQDDHQASPSVDIPEENILYYRWGK